MTQKIKTKCHNCGKVLKTAYYGKTVIRKCSGCGRMNRIDGTPEGKPAYVLSLKARIGASQ